MKGLGIDYMFWLCFSVFAFYMFQSYFNHLLFLFPPPSLHCFLYYVFWLQELVSKQSWCKYLEKEQLLLYITLEDIRCVFTTNNQVKTLPLFFRHSLLLDETRVWRRSSSRQEKHNRKKQAVNVKARGWTISRLSFKCLFPSPFTMCSHA